LLLNSHEFGVAGNVVVVWVLFEDARNMISSCRSWRNIYLPPIITCLNLMLLQKLVIWFWLLLHQEVYFVGVISCLWSFLDVHKLNSWSLDIFASCMSLFFTHGVYLIQNFLVNFRNPILKITSCRPIFHRFNFFSTFIFLNCLKVQNFVIGIWL
jgi:hypothetical protein